MRRVWAVCTVWLAVSPLSEAAERRPMTAVDLIEVPRLQDPRLAPASDSVVFVRSDADWKENRRVPHLWLARDGEPERQLTFGDGETSPRWSPDGETIAFLAKRQGDEERQLYLLPVRGGEARRLTEHPTAVSEIAWTPDGAHLLFLASDEKPAELKRREKAKDDVFAFDEDYQQRHLWRVAAATGERERVTDGDFSILAYRLADDGSQIVLHRAPTPRIDDSDESEVWIAEADGSNPMRLTSNSVNESGARLSPRRDLVLFVSGANDEFESYYNRNVFLVPAGGGEPQLLLPELPYEIWSAEWTADGAAIVFLANTGLRSQLFRYRLADGRLDQLTEGDHAIGSWTYDRRRDRHLYTVNEPTNAGDVWLADGSGEPRRMTHVFDYLAREFVLPRQEAISWRGRDGRVIEGLLFYPLGYEPGTTYPLVVQTHGGPASSDRFGFGSWASYQPLLAARGWLVFRPNYRGSTGYGDDFLRDMVGHYFHQAHLDVLSGVDHLVAEGLADPERLVKMGWSAGGHMTNKILTVTQRFKAASSGAGAVNWISMYGQSDVRIYRTPWFGGTPWQKDAPIDLYWEHSPLREIWKVTTPTLVLVGAEDVRVPPPQSIELYRALRSLGVPTKLYMAPREPHGWRELRHELFKINVELDWFERWALGREYSWETAPELEPESDESH